MMDTLALGSIVNSVAVFAFLMIGATVGKMEFLAPIMLDPFILFFTCFAGGFGISVFMSAKDVQRYERMNGI